MIRCVFLLTQQEAEELAAKEAARLAKAKELNAQTKEANRTLQAFKMREAQREREQEAAIEAYARKKAEIQVTGCGLFCVVFVCVVCWVGFVLGCSTGFVGCTGPMLYCAGWCCDSCYWSKIV